LRHGTAASAQIHTVAWGGNRFANLSDNSFVQAGNGSLLETRALCAW
jgi:hypothetical protein